jgi:iron complex outermembrane receptor protein
MDPAMEPTFAFYPDGTPVAEGAADEGALFTYMNFGAATVRGADLGASYLPIDELELEAGLSLIQLASFENDSALQSDLLLNVPTVKLKGAVTMSGIGFDDYFLKLAGRYRNRHDFESGYWSTARFGQAPASVITDLSAGYDLPRQGLTLTATVANLFDSHDPDVLGAPVPGRFAFLQLGYRLD